MKIFKISTIPLSLNVLLEGQLKWLNNEYEVTAISGRGDDLIAVEVRESVKTVSIEMERRISIRKDIVSLVKLYRLFKKEKPTIVHSITPKAGLLSMMAGKFAGVPIRIHTFTGLIFPSKHGLFKKLLVAMDKILCWAATDVYPEGEGVKRDLESFKITKKELRVLANGSINGVNLNFFSRDLISEREITILRNSLNIDSNDFVYLFVGRLTGDKGINELVAAFSEISKGGFKLLLVGPFEAHLDPLKDETLLMIQLNPNIITVGYQKDVRKYFAISDCLVFPSYREGFPNVVLQAGAMSLPSIVTDINGSNEIIIDGKNGIIIPKENKEFLKKAMIEIWEDKTKFKNLKENSRKMIEERYDQAFVWRALLNEYNKLLKQTDV